MSAVASVAPINRRQAALDLAGRGFRLVPLPDRAKGPPPKGWQTLATADRETVCRWWDDRPHSNIGIVTGNGILVVDLDVRDGKNGIAAFQEIARPFGGVPATLTAITGSGGRHLLWRYPKQLTVPSVNGKLAPGIDIKADAGYVVGVGSYMGYRDAGRRYQWEDGTVAIADAPGWLLDLVVERKREATGKPKAEHQLTEDDVRAMLAHIKGDTYEQWCRGLWALAGSQREDLELLEVADDWSRDQLGYTGADDVRRKFEQANGQLGISSLWALAITGGWQPTAEQRARLQPPIDPREEFPDLGPLPGRFAVLSAAEFAGVLRPRQWRVKGLLLAGAELNLVVGDSGSGKSFWALDLAAAVHTGRPFGGRPTAQGKVVYIVAEGAGDFKYRLHGLAKHHGLALDALPAVVPAAPNLDQPADTDALIKSIVAAGGADFVVLDTLTATAPGLDQNADMQRYVAACQLIGARLRAQVLVIHHVGKDPSKGPRGGSSLKAAADTVLTIERSGDTRTATVTKSKGGEDGARFAFRLASVALGIDADGAVFGSCVVEHTDATDVRPERAQPQGRWQRAVFAVCTIAPKQSRDIVDEVLAAQPIDRSDPAEVKNARRAIRRALQELTDRKLLHIHADGGIATTSAVAGGPL